MKIYHDHDEDGNWTRISNIKQFPLIPNRTDETSQVSFVVDDFEGALYATWEGYDFIPIKITDEGTVILFRGFLHRKKYNNNSLSIVARGLSSKLDSTPFTRNYKYKEGTVKTVPHAGNDTIELQDIDGDPITWAVDQLIDGRECGIVIRDTSENWDTTVWTVTAISDINEHANAGNAANCNTDDGTYYYTDDWAILDAIITPVISGANIDSTLKKLKEIVITYKIGTYLKGIPVDKKITMEIEYNGTDWVEIFSRASGGTDVVEVWSSSTFTITGTATELAKYLTKTGDNYDGIVNIRITMESITSTEAFLNYVKIDFLKADIRYYETDITPISEAITDNGPSWIECSGIDFTTSGVVGESAPGSMDGDSFMIGFSTYQILNEVFAACSVGLQIDTTLTKFIAQQFKGTNGKEILNKIKLLEGVHWFEDHVLNQVRIAHKDDFVDSTEDLTQSDYTYGWELEDDNNYYSAVEVFGCAGYNIYYKAVDPAFPVTNKSPMIKTIIEETVMTVAEARDIAEAQLEELKTKRPSIKIPLKGVYTNIRAGKTVGLTMARPTRANDDYPIRKVERKRLGHGEIETIVYCGLGHSTLEERIAGKINKAVYLARQAHTDRLISTNYAPGVFPSFGDIVDINEGVQALIDAAVNDDVYNAINWNGQTDAASRNAIRDEIEDIYTFADQMTTVAEVETIIDTEINAGQSIDNAIDSLIATHTAAATAHQDAPALIAAAIINDAYNAAGWNGQTDAASRDAIRDELESMKTETGLKQTAAEVRTIIDSEIDPGQSIDNAIDSLIATHTADDDAHHTPATISDDIYNAIGWNGVTTIGASKNAIRDEIEDIYTFADQMTTVAEVETIIDTEINAGQSIDNAIDSLIATHTADDDAHHVKYTDANAIAAIAFDDTIYTKAEIDLKKLSDWVAPTSNIAMNTKKFTGMGAGADANDSVRFEQVEDAIGHEHQHNISVILLEDLILFGAGNKAWVPMMYEGCTGTMNNMVSGGVNIQNTGAVDFYFHYTLTIPPAPNGMRLFITGCRVRLVDADGGDYIGWVRVYGRNAGLSLINQDDTDYNSVALWTDTWVAHDCSGYEDIVAYMAAGVTNAGDLKIQSVQIECYYID